jgi:hypothetical protein
MTDKLGNPLNVENPEVNVELKSVVHPDFHVINAVPQPTIGPDGSVNKSSQTKQAVSSSKPMAAPTMSSGSGVAPKPQVVSGSG